MYSPTNNTTILVHPPLASFDFEGSRCEVFVSARQPTEYYYTPVLRLTTSDDGAIDVQAVKLMDGFHKLSLKVEFDPPASRQMALGALQSVVPGATAVRPLPLARLGWRIVDPIPLEKLGITVYQSVMAAIASGGHAPLELLVAGDEAHATQIKQAMQRFRLSARLTFAAWTAAATHEVDIKTGQLGMSRAWRWLWGITDAHQRRATIGQVLRLAEQFRREIGAQPNQHMADGRAASEFERLTIKCVDNPSTRVVVWSDAREPVLLQNTNVCQAEIEKVLNDLFHKTDGGHRQFREPRSGSTESQHWALWGCGWTIDDGSRWTLTLLQRMLREKCGLWVTIVGERLVPTRFEAVSISYRNIMPGARQLVIARLHTGPPSGVPLDDNRRMQREMQLSTGQKRKMPRVKEEREAKRRIIE